MAGLTKSFDEALSLGFRDFMPEVRNQKPEERLSAPWAAGGRLAEVVDHAGLPLAQAGSLGFWLWLDLWFAGCGNRGRSR